MVQGAEEEIVPLAGVERKEGTGEVKEEGGELRRRARRGGCLCPCRRDVDALSTA